MDKSYNYRTSFFKRNMLTRANKRLFSITVAVALVMVSFTIFSLDWALHVSPTAFSESISKNYVSFLEKSSEAGDFTDMNIPLDESAGRYNFEEPAPEKSLAEILKEMDDRKIALPSEEKNRANQFRNQYISPEASGITAITAAIERVPSLTELPSFQSRSEKPLALQNESDFMRNFSKPLNIPRPETVSFASTNGNRDMQETSAVINLNDSEIEHCVEEFTRFNRQSGGDFEVKFTIHPNGYVIPSSIKIVNANITDFRVLNCIKKRIKRWRNFPKIALEDGNFTVTRKYVF